jgi:hypothetical protein
MNFISFLSFFADLYSAGRVFMELSVKEKENFLFIANEFNFLLFHDLKNYNFYR